MYETIEFDRLACVHASTISETGLTCNIDLFLLYDVVFIDSAISRIIAFIVHDIISMGNLAAVVWDLLDSQQFFR